jgi:hypothetical protein
VARFEPVGSATVVAGVGQWVHELWIGTRLDLDNHSATTRVLRTGRSARVDDDDYSPASGVTRRLSASGGKPVFIVAEALTNTVKHARASSAQVAAAVDGSLLRLAVRDDGVGGARSHGSSGLLGLRDRAAALNGELHNESPPGDGTVVAATLPIPGSQSA